MNIVSKVGDDDAYVLYEGGDDHGHDHDHTEKLDLKGTLLLKKQQRDKENTERINKAMSKLKLVSFVSVFFIAAQSTGGYLANSIAIFADTVHLASDMVGFGMSIIALNLSQRESSSSLTYGWHRAEILGAIISVVFLVTLTLWLLVAAIGRVTNPQPIDGVIMLITAICGLFFNLVQMSILHQGDDHFHMGGGHAGHDHGEGGHDHGHGADHKHDHGDAKGHSHGEEDKEDTGSKKSDASKKSNINVDAAFLHALGDMIMSIGVIISATVIYIWPSARIADPICTFVFSIIVCVTVYPIMKNCIKILMEGSPEEVELEDLKKEIMHCDKDQTIEFHDFHLWSISSGKYAMTAHVICEKDPMRILKTITQICNQNYGIDHVTVQMEQIVGDDVFECEQDC